jgi:multidrug resistance efflux pump
VEILGTLGQTVESTTPLFAIGDLTNLWVLLDIFESQLALVKVGQPVAIAVAALPGRTFEGASTTSAKSSTRRLEPSESASWSPTRRGS